MDWWRVGLSQAEPGPEKIRPQEYDMAKRKMFFWGARAFDLVIADLKEPEEQGNS
jgi:hypothetical protein